MPAFLQTSCSEDRRFNYGFYIATKRQLVFGTPQDGLENKLHASEKQLPNLFLTPRWPRQSIKSAKLIIEKVCVCVHVCNHCNHSELTGLIDSHRCGHYKLLHYSMKASVLFIYLFYFCW